MKTLMKLNQVDSITYYKSKRVVTIPETYKQKRNELRGVWVSTVANIDIPKLEDIKSYQLYLKHIVETVASYHMNKIIFQVRPANDAFYNSAINPWSRFITGVEDQNPGFDILQFVIDEAKKYNIKVHAWMNPYRVSTQELPKLNMTKEEYLDTLSEKNFARKYKDETILDGIQKIILKPASQKVRDYVCQSIMEVIEKYDIEGVHIDDYFYPYAKVPETEEQEDYDRLKLVDESFADWRRRNVDMLIEQLSNDILAYNQFNHKNVQFGISPFALFRTSKKLLPTGWEKGSMNNPSILQCYDDLYSDIYKWMEKKWIDYVVPQAYFPFEHERLPYADIVSWWAKRAEETGTNIYIGQAFYQIGTNDVWKNTDEIINQLTFNQKFKNIKGSIFFTFKNFLPQDNTYLTQAQEKLRRIWNKNQKD
jgi:uncharacterized lipoprotein YddW (UPF0748 family)